MQRALGVASFSQCVPEMNGLGADRRCRGPWALGGAGSVVHRLGFGAAWYGLARLIADGVKVCGKPSFTPPDGFFAHWQSMPDQDLLACDMIEHSGKTAINERRQKRRTEGLVDLSDKLGLARISTAMHGHYGPPAAF